MAFFLKNAIPTIAGIALLTIISTAARAQSITYYVDASNGNDANNGTTTGTAWKTTAKVNSVTAFQSGDQILFKSGQIFSGALAPKGSGAPGSRIRLGAYGSGNKPMIVANSGDSAAVQLMNQHHWTIDGLDASGGSNWGIWVSSQSNTTCRGITITNCSVHDADIIGHPGLVGQHIDTSILFGLIHLSLLSVAGSRWDSIDIENNTAYSSLGNGISVYGQWGLMSTNVTIRNNTVYNVGPRGIHMMNDSIVLAERNLVYNVANNAFTSGTGFEVWGSNNVVWQFNESYNTKPVHSGPDNDNGAFDIDYDNSNVTAQYNYGHGAAGYGISCFAAQWGISSNYIVRYNVFANNDKWSSSSRGSIFVAAWDNGSFNGIKIYNNTIYHNPAASCPAFTDSNAVYTGTNPNFFKNNVIYSSVPSMYSRTGNMTTDNNLYYSPAGAATFTVGSTNYSSLSSVQSAGSDYGSKEGNPLLSNPTFSDNGMSAAASAFTPSGTSPAINAGVRVDTMGTRDYAGTAIPQGGLYDMGAIEIAQTQLPTFYTDVSYGGSSTGLELGWYNMSALSGRGIPNDAISSIKIPKGYKVYAYPDDNFSGTSWTFTADNNNLNSVGANDAISSIFVDLDPAAYFKISNHTSGLVLDGGGNWTAGSTVDQYNNLTSTNLEWSITNQWDGYYKIKNHTTSLVLDGGGNVSSGSVLKQYSDMSSTNLEWGFSYVGNGYYKLINRTNLLVVDGTGTFTPGASAKQYYNVSSPNLEWYLAPANGTANTSAVTPSAVNGLASMFMVNPAVAENNIYPCPARVNSRVNLIYNGGNRGQGKLELYDAGGRLLFSRQLSLVEGVNQIAIDVPGVGAGLYFAVLSTSQRKVTYKLIVE